MRSIYVIAYTAATVLTLLTALTTATQAAEKSQLEIIVGPSTGTRTASETRDYGGDIMTVDTLRKCLALAASIDESQVKLEMRRSMLKREQENVALVVKEMAPVKNYVEKNRVKSTKSQDSIDTFNQNVLKLNQLVTEYNAAAEKYNTAELDFNEQVDAHNGLREAHTSTCAGKSYYEDDLKKAAGSRPGILQAID